MAPKTLQFHDLKPWIARIMQKRSCRHAEIEAADKFEPDLIDSRHAACLVVDGIKGLLGSPRVVIDHFPAVGYSRVGSHKHD